jgi:hypothetical protein
MTDAALLLALWVSVPVLAAGAASLRERHERRFPDCPVCKAQKGPSDAQNGPVERRTAAL